MSDVHLEFEGPLPQWNNAPTAQHLALLGDIGLLCSKQHIDRYADFLAYCCKRHSRGLVFLVVGNHEGYHIGMLEDIKILKRMKEGEKGDALRNLVVLDCDAVDMPNSDVRVLGCCLWSEPTKEAVNVMNDFRLIRGCTFETYRDTHRKHVAWLEAECARAVHENKRVVIFTHHAPIVDGLVPQASIGKTLTEAGCLGSHLVPAKFNNTKYKGALKYWCYGHTHLSLRQQFDGLNIVSNQAGYPHDQSKTSWFATIAAPFTSWVQYDPNFMIAL